MNKEIKKQIHDALKPIMKKNGLKFTTTLKDGCDLTVFIRSGNLDFVSLVNEMNNDAFEKNTKKIEKLEQFQFNFGHDRFLRDHKVAKLLTELYNKIESVIKKVGKYYNNSNAQIDYFDTAFYYNIYIGEFEKPYKFI